MAAIDLQGGTIECRDTGGTGPIVLFLHGLMMDASLWDGVVGPLAETYRCIVPTLPFGAHQRAMPADADLSLPGIARLVEELLERLDLTDVTVVGNDTGGAVAQLLMVAGNRRITRAVLVSCDAFDNFPPGLTGKTLKLTGALSPAMFGLFMQQLRLRAIRRLPIAFGWLTKYGDPATVGWLEPLLHYRDIRRDTVRMLRAVFADRQLLVDVAQRLPAFDGPALVVWATEDRVMPPEHGARLASLLPAARLVVIADSYTLIPLDQPARLGQAIQDFIGTSAGQRDDRFPHS